MKMLKSLVSTVLMAFVMVGCGGGGSSTATATTSISTLNIVSIDIEASNVTLPKGTDVIMKATANFDNNTSEDVTNSTNWLSSNENILNPDVNTNGVFTAMQEGISVITAQFGGYEKNLTITVTSAELASVEVTPDTVSLANGQSTQLTASGIYTDNSTIDLTGSVQWFTSDPAIVTVDNNGLLTSHQVGNADVYAAMDSIDSNTIGVTVGNAVLASIKITPSSTQIIAQETVSFTANGVLTDGTQNDITNSVVWSSSNNAIATIDSSGVATGVTAGTVTVTAQSGSIVDTASLSVTEATLVSISLNIPTSVEAGKTADLKATGTYNNNTQLDISSLVTWTSDDTSIASISSTTVLGESVGTVSITASLNGISQSGNINVVPEKWWNYMSVVGGSSSSVIINGYVQAGSWKNFILLNSSTSSTLRVTRLYGLDANNNIFLDKPLSIDLPVGLNLAYTITLNSNVLAPTIYYTVEDTSTGVSHSFSANW